MNGYTPMSVTTSSRSSASERSSSGSAEESWTVNPWSCGQRSKITSRRAARSSSSGGSSALRFPSWTGFMPSCPQGACPASVQGAHEGLAPKQVCGLGPGGHGGADRRGNGAVDLVVLRLAQARCERDLEDEELPFQRGRIDVIGQPAAVAHAEAK